MVGVWKWFLILCAIGAVTDAYALAKEPGKGGAVALNLAASVFMCLSVLIHYGADQ